MPGQNSLDNRGLPAYQHANANHSQQRTDFHGCENVLYPFAILKAFHIGPGQKRNDQQRNQLSGRKRERIFGQDMYGPNDVIILRNLRPQNAQVTGEPNRRRGDGSGLND